MASPPEKVPFPPSPPLLVVLSGPSGVGKDALLLRLWEQGGPLHRVVTATTRPPRPGEREGVDYRFVTPDLFRRMIEEDEFLEWAQVYGHLYGVPRDSVRRGLAEGKDVVVRTDVQGAATIRRKAPQALLVFLAPPSLATLEERLRGRGTDSSEQVTRRLQEAEGEMRDLSLFDYRIVNEDGGLEAAVETLVAIMAAERRRIPPRRVVV